jgi:nitrogen regulation protein NR(I)
MAKLLVIDDEKNVCYSLEKALASDELDVVCANTATDGIERVRSESPDVVLLDVRLPDFSGLEAYGKIREIDPRLPVVVITAHSTTETAIEAMKMGAYEYLLKPVDLQQLRQVVAGALDLSRLNRVPAVLDGEDRGEMQADPMIGQSASMQSVYKAIGRVASQDVAVLILGESGTGKELVARAIYQHSRRSKAPLLAINCAAIPETLLESELFGHEKGSFTGADRRRIGKFEQASGGTLFLDEVGDMSFATQSKLLRLLQEQRFERVGGNETIRTDVRIIAATNHDLAALAAAGRFREDLFYRLNVFAVRVPPLRDRMDDLPLLVDHFVERSSRELGKNVRSISADSMQMLARHNWPGNVRELESTLKYAMVHATGNIITPDCLPDVLRMSGTTTKPNGEDAVALDVGQYSRRLLAANQSNIYHTVLSAVDRVVLGEVLRHTKGNQVEAARLLGVSRNTLRAKLRSLGMTLEKQLAAESERPEQ